MILLIVLIVSAFLLILIRLAKFVNDFGHEKQYLLNEMHRAADYNEYRYWRRELRCLYLCLIPFVTERSVMKVYHVCFHRAKYAKKRKRSDGLLHILAPSILAICICAICICGVSWAWFTANVSAGTTAMQSSSYQLLYEINRDAAVVVQADAGAAAEPADADAAAVQSEADTAALLPNAGAIYTLADDTCVIILKAIGTPGATGYCSVQIGDETYYTEQIFVDDTPDFTFTVRAAGGTNIVLTPRWGTCAVRDASNTITNGAVVTAAGLQQGDTQMLDNSVANESPTEPPAESSGEPSTEPETPNVSTPEENEPTGPEQALGPAPTQPEESVDTEPSPEPSPDPSPDPENTELASPEPTDTVSDPSE